MSRHRKSDYQQQLEMMIREALRTLHGLPNIGLAPAQFRSCMPEIVRSIRDMDYAPETTKVVRFGATRAAISRLDRILVAVSGADLTELQRDIVWARGKRTPFKVIAMEQGISTRTARRHHSNALAEVAAYMIALERKAVAPFRVGLKAVSKL